MTISKLFLPFLLTLIGLAGSVSASNDLVSDVQKGCANEIEEYCSQVTPGEKRMLSCFYAHEDKLSGRCQHTLYQASEKLKQAIVALNYVAGQCKDDILAHCADIAMGDGRVAQCLRSNADNISTECKQAMSDIFK